ncbi:MAG: hypothetical protein WBW85_18015 [Terriglobales bacterium]
MRNLSFLISSHSFTTATVAVRRWSLVGKTFIAIVLVVRFPAAASAKTPKQPGPDCDQAQQSTEELTLSIEYRNRQYGFCLALPETWRGYSVLQNEWAGSSETSTDDVPAARGPIISIRHPRWTAEDPHQDIPIMVFTLAQWRRLENGEFWVSAAPIGPGELGRNSKYVFAIPPRFDYSFPTGWEEVWKIVQSDFLHAPCNARPKRH